MQGKECSRKGPTIRIRVNLQGMDSSRKSRNGISKEQYLQGKEFARDAPSTQSATTYDYFMVIVPYDKTRMISQNPAMLLLLLLFCLSTECEV